MSKRSGGQGLPDVEFPADAEYVALVRLEKPGGFVEPGEVVRLERARATVLLAAGLVASFDSVSGSAQDADSDYVRPFDSAVLDGSAQGD